MAPQLKITYGDQAQVAIAADVMGVVRKLHEAKLAIKKELDLPEEEYNLYDAYGLIENDADLQRTFHKFNKGEEDLEVEVRNSWEHNHFMRIRRMEDRQSKLEERLAKVEATLKSDDEKTGFVGHANKIQDLQSQVLALVDRVVVTEKFPSEVHEPIISELKMADEKSSKAIEELTKTSAAHAAGGTSTSTRVNNLEDLIKEIREAEGQTKQEIMDLQRMLDGMQTDLQSATGRPPTEQAKRAGWSSPDELPLRFKIDDQTVFMKVEHTDTVALVKAMLQGKCDIHRKQQDLQFDGKSLADDQLLSHYNLAKNSTLQVLVSE